MRPSTSPFRTRLRFLILALPVTTLCIAAALTSPAQEHREIPAEVMPTYDSEGRLLLPTDYEQWVFAGSSLGMSYSEGQAGTEMFHHTLIEPSAYAHFRRTGEFRQGTMFVLLLHGTGEGVLPQRRGRFADAVRGLEMAVKDADHSGSETTDWAYYGFAGAEGMRDRATAFSPSACASCHVEHPAYDNVFMQFYPLLAAAAPEDRGFALARSGGAPKQPAAPAPQDGSDEAKAALVLSGYDPVLLSEGQQELGKAEIVYEHGGWRYQFVSEPTRARFAAEPERYGVQNETCPVVPGAAVNPDLYAVHGGRIYLFASAQCVETFNDDPQAFTESRPRQGTDDLT